LQKINTNRYWIKKNYPPVYRPLICWFGVETSIDIAKTVTFIPADLQTEM
jgi:hypothetical protein